VQLEPLPPSAATNHQVSPVERAALLGRLSGFQTASMRRSVAQFGVAIGGYVGIIGLMYATPGVSTLLTLALAVPAAGFVVKLFIIQHDCGHGSYFRSRRANEIIGWVCSLVTFTPYGNWRRQHAGHHAVWNNLDQRHAGSDI
jgi:omega-6 fatty acid desaturase (delta-12 desaturase)